MARRMGRRAPAPGFESWRAVMDGTGAWVIVNQRGEQPLRAPDPVVRLYNIHLAASAPTLREALEALARRFERLEIRRNPDVRLVQLSWGAIIASRQAELEFPGASPLH